MNKIKVLMVGNHESVKGGITSVIGQLMKHEWGNDNISIKFIPTYVEKNNIVKMIYFVFAYIKIWSYILFCKPTLAHIHMSYRGSFHRKYVIHKMCRRHKVRDIIHLHGSEFEKWYNESDEKVREKIRKLLREVGAFVVLGDKWNKVIKGIEPLTNTIVVSNAVDIPDEKVEWNNERVNILFLGVLIKRKGVGELIDAVKELKSSNEIGNMYFMIAGTGKEETALKEKCKSLNLDNEINFVGWIDGEEKKNLMKECQIMILPSYNEGLPISILEAIAYGMPIIATDVGDMASAVKNDKNGYLIRPGNVNDIKEALIRISKDSERYAEMSHMSRKIAEEQFSSKVFYKRISECYKSLLDE